MTQADSKLSSEMGAAWAAGDTDGSSFDVDVRAAVARSTRRFVLEWVFAAVGIAIGVAVPIAVLLSRPTLFWFAWALDIWVVVVVSLVASFARGTWRTADDSTESHLALLRRRARVRLRASTVGIWLASLQFVVLPLLCVWRLRQVPEQQKIEVLVTFVAVGAVMVVFWAWMRRVRARTGDTLAELQNDDLEGGLMLQVLEQTTVYGVNLARDETGAGTG